MDRRSADLIVLLDTHALLWWRAGGERLSRAASRAIRSAERLLVSPISFWEVATLERLGRIALDRPTGAWLSDLLADERLDVAELSPHLAVAAGSLPDGFPGDPADRLIYATAAGLRVPLLSKDDRLRAFARRTREVRIVW